MPYRLNIVLFLILLAPGCRQLSNRVQPIALECGEDFVAYDNRWVRAESSTGTLLERDAFEVIAFSEGTCRAQEVSSKGCFELPMQSEWIVRSNTIKESILIHSDTAFNWDSHRLQLEPHSGEGLKLVCPTKPISADSLAMEQILKLDASIPTRLAVTYKLYDANAKTPLAQNTWLLGSPSLPLISHRLADGSYNLKFHIQDLRLDQMRDHECNVQVDNTLPDVDVDRIHLSLDQTQGKDFFVIARQEQLRFKSNLAEKDEIKVEYCFHSSPEEVAAGSVQNCSPDKVKIVTVGEPISPSVNSGIWDLYFSAVDTAGNRSDWKHIGPILYADSSTMQEIRLESRADMLQTEITKFYGIFDVLHKAFKSYATWKNLATEFERSKTKDSILSLFYAAYIGMNNYSQFIGLADKSNNMIMTADGDRLIAGLYNGDLQVFNLKTKKLVSTLKGHWTTASSFSLSRDSKILVSASFDQTIKVWDLEAEKLLGTLACCEGEFVRVALAPDKQSIVSSSWKNIIKIWSIDGALQKSISAETEQNFHKDVIMSIKISPDGKYFATGSWDRTVRLWDMESGSFLRKMTSDHADGVNDLDFSRDSRFLISAGKDGQILVHNVMDGSLYKRLATLSASVTSIDVGNQHVISGSLDNAIRVWNLEAGQLVEGPLKVGYFGMDDVTINARGNIYASTVNSSIVRLWGSNGESDFVQNLRGHVANSSIRSLVLDEKQHKLFSGGTDGRIMAWDMKTGAGSIVDQTDTIYDMKISPQKDYLYASSKDGRLRRYALESLATEAPVFARPGTWLFSMEFDPGTSQIYFGSWDGLILAPKGAEDFAEARVSVGWAKLLFEPKSQKLLLLSRDKYLGLFDPLTMVVTKKLGFEEAVISGRLSKDGRTVFVGVWNGTVAAVDLASFAESYHFDAEGGIVWDLLEEGSTGYLLTTSNDGKVRIWDTKDRQVMGVPLLVSSKAPRAILYSEKEGLLITGDDDGLVKVWKLPLTRDIEVLRRLVCADAGDVLRSSWFIEKYKVQLQDLCEP